MVKVVKVLVDRLDREEITNMQCITMHGKDMVDEYREWCAALGFEEGDEDGAEQFVNELRFGDGPDDGDWPEEVPLMNERQIDIDFKGDDIPKNGSQSYTKESPMGLLQEWKAEKGRLNSLKTSENAIRITLWRYQNPFGSKQGCSTALNITRNNVKKWWNIPTLIDTVLADGGHVHPIRLDHDTIKRTILQAVEKIGEG